MRSRRPDRGRVGRIRLGGGGARRRDGASWRRATAAGIRPRWWRAATGFTPACCSGGGVGIARRRTPTPDCSSWSSTHPSTSGATPVVWAAGAKMGDAGGEGREEGSRGRPARGEDASCRRAGDRAARRARNRHGAAPPLASAPRSPSSPSSCSLGLLCAPASTPAGSGRRLSPVGLDSVLARDAPPPRPVSYESLCRHDTGITHYPGVGAHQVSHCVGTMRNSA